jgi:hypothetical protein
MTTGAAASWEVARDRLNVIFSVRFEGQRASPPPQRDAVASNRSARAGRA